MNPNWDLCPPWRESAEGGIFFVWENTMMKQLLETSFWCGLVLLLLAGSLTILTLECYPPGETVVPPEETVVPPTVDFGEPSPLEVNDEDLHSDVTLP